MKTLFIGLFALGNVSSYAANCTYVLNHTGINAKAEPVIEDLMKKKGFTRTYGEGSFILTTSSRWWTGTWNGMEHEGGDSFGSAALIEASSGKELASYTSQGRASFLNVGIGKDATAIDRTKDALKNLPNCDKN